MPFPYGKTVTIVKRSVSGQDEFGNDVTTSTTFDVSPCPVQPATSREELSFTDQLIRRIVAFVPYGTDVTYTDAIIVDGVQYEISGMPDVWESPFSTSVAPIRIEAIKVEGASP